MRSSAGSPTTVASCTRSRTLSSSAAPFNPLGYHLGTVRPHENSMIAAGFRRYGFDDLSERLFNAIVDAATEFPAHLRRQSTYPFPR